MITFSFSAITYGLLITLVTSTLGFLIAQTSLMHALGLSALTCALLLGMLAGNLFTWIHHPVFAPGLTFAKQKLLRWGIILFGFHITFQQLTAVGIAGLLMALFILATVIVLGLWCAHWLKIDKEQGLLISAGAAICGAAAIIATAATLQSSANKVAVAVATVVLFGTIGIFLYPVLYPYLSVHFNFLPSTMGLYIGGSVHEVAQVVAAAHPLGAEIESTAIITKMTRVILLFPFLLALRWWGQRTKGTATQSSFPWFAVGFILVIGIHSLHFLPVYLTGWLKILDTFFLTMAMAALGIGTQFSALRMAGLRPILCALVLFIWLVIAGAFISHLLVSML